MDVSPGLFEMDKIVRQPFRHKMKRAWINIMWSVPEVALIFKKKRRFVQLQAVLFLFYLFFMYLFVCHVSDFSYDSNYYWTSADGVLANGDFYLYAFPQTFRGYLFPLMMTIFKRIGAAVFGSELIVFWIVTSLSIAVSVAVVFPYLFDVKVDTYAMLLKLLVCSGVILYFWGDFILYPLSDLPAALMMCAGTALLKFAFTASTETVKGSAYFTGFMAGVCFYGAYNTRAVYLYGVLVVIAGFLLLGFKQKRGVQDVARGGILLAVIVGCAMIAVPQILINGHYTGQYTLWVPTEQYVLGDLKRVQVYWGLLTDRYDTYNGDPSHYPVPSVVFADNVGTEILGRMGVDLDNFSYGTLITLFLAYPLDMCGIYARHLVALLTPCFGESYISDLFVPKNLRITIIVLLWLLWGVYIVYITSTKKQFRLIDVLAIGGPLIPCLMQLFGSPEIRFFIAVHLFLYFYLCCCVEWRALRWFIKSHLIQIAVPCIVIFFAWITIMGDILQQSQYARLLMG